MKNKKLVWIVVILVVVIVGLVMGKKTGLFGKDEGTKVTAEKAAKRTIIETVTATGKISPEVEVKVSPDISGEIVELNVNEGDSVKRGQVVARIYADIYASQRDLAMADVSRSEAAVANANAQLGALEATLQQAKTNYDRQKKLLDEKIISRSEFEQAEQAYKSAQANYNAAKAGIKGNIASIEGAKASLNKASKDMARATIIAPMSGVVSLLNVKKGERVAGNSLSIGTEMMRIADLASIVAQVDVPENDIPKVKFGDTAIVTVEAFGNRKFKGIVFKIANPSTATGATTSSTDVTNYKVHVRLLPETYADLIAKGRPFPFRPNMTATADIQTRTVKDGLSVPLAAVTTRDKKGDVVGKKDDAKSSNNANDQQKNTSSENDVDEVVFVLQADSINVKKVKVKVDVQDLNNIQIVSGLKEGEMVITGPYNLLKEKLKEGDKVKVVAKDKLFEEKKKD
jgi:HlyD family secretion protein